MSRKERVICGLDIGTSKTCMVIGRPTDQDTLQIVSTGYALSKGLRKGIVIDVEEVSASIRKATDEAELKSGISVDWVTAGISGDHVQSFNCHGAVPIEGKLNEVTQEDMAKVIQAARSIPVPAGREIIHILPQEFYIDNRGEIRNPVGLAGLRLDVDVHVVTCEEFLKQNVINAVNSAQMRVSRIVLQQLASAEAVLTRDEKELGAVVIDIGGGTTDIAVLVKGSFRYTSVLPVGGDHFTRDLAIGLRTPIEHAERLKKELGTVLLDEITEDEVIDAPGIGTRAARTVPRSVACRIIRDRALEVLELVKSEIARSGARDHLSAGAILTGGGSLLEGMAPLAEEVLQLPVREGLPQGIQGLSDELSHPVYATAVGLALYALRSERDNGAGMDTTGAVPSFLNKFLSWVAT